MSASKMLEEVRQQPDVLQKTLKSELRRIGGLERLVAHKKPRFIVLVARGTSDNAAQFGRYLLEITTGIPVSLSAPSIFTLYKSNVNLADSLVVAISQSGESTDTNLVLERARKQGALTVGITNESSSTLAKLADYVFLVRAGKEKSVAATKTYTGQLLALYLLAYALGGSIRIDDLRRLPDWTAAALKLENEVAENAQRYRFMEHALVVGRGLNYSNAFELALKLMETCYVVAERFSSADLLHGPIAMLEASFPVFLFAPPGVTWPGLRELIGRLSEIKTETLIVTDLSNWRAVRPIGGERLVHKICIPVDLAYKQGPTDLFTPIPYIVPAQLFAGWLAHVKGLDPDRPRALKKVTQTM
jgi:glucosamine--fructose-6-phosphate aminotransferase (isomerizing)